MKLMSVTAYIEKFQLEKNYPHKRLEIKPEQIFSLQELHFEGKKLEKSAPEEDSCWGSSGPFRTIHANEIKRKGNMGVDIGDINIPIDAILQTGSDGVGHSYLVLERGNCRVQAFDGSRGQVGTQYENRELLQHQYIESGSNDNTRAPLVTCGQWFESCIADHENGYENYFIGVSNEDRPGTIKCFDAAWEKITDLKLSQPVYGICVIPGDSFSKAPKLACITKFDVKSQFKYQLRTWDIMEKGSMKNKPSNIVIDFLTRLNQDDDRSRITHMASWSNQLYIVDAARHMVYLTDLKGRLRTSIGRSKSDKEGEFNEPRCLVVDGHGNFIVADKYRLQAFDFRGEFLTIIDVSIMGITGLQIDNLGRLFASSRINHEIYCFKVISVL